MVSLTNAPQYIQAVYKYYYELAHELQLLNESEQVHICTRAGKHKLLTFKNHNTEKLTWMTKLNVGSWQRG